MGKNNRNNYKKYSENTFFVKFFGDFSPFSGLEWGEDSCNFSPFLRDFSEPRGLPGLCKGKNNPENLFGLFLTSKGYFNFSGYLK